MNSKCMIVTFQVDNILKKIIRWKMDIVLGLTIKTTRYKISL